jgi:hypothetical protein
MIVQVGWPRVNRLEDVAAPEKIEVHSKDRSRDRVHCGHLIVLCFGGDSSGLMHRDGQVRVVVVRCTIGDLQ